MLKFLLVSALMASSSEPCAVEDTSCLLRKIDTLNQENKSLREELRLRITLDTLRTEEIRGLREVNSQLSQALVQAQKALTEVHYQPWYQSPSFVYPAGVLSGVALTVLSAWAVGQASAAR